MSIKIISWNLSFGCMASNKNSYKDRSARKIAEYCHEMKIDKNYNVCLNNAVKQLSTRIYDFIGLQEVTNYELIYKKLKKIHAPYLYTHHRGGIEDMITIYNSDRFKLDYVTVGGLKKNTRPYQILFLTEIKTNKKFIVMNLHMPHDFHDNDNIQIYDKNKIKEKVANLLLKQYPASYYNANLQQNIGYIKHNSDNSKYINDFATEFNTIIMGDFNDHSNYDLWKGFNPFISIKNSVIKNIKVNSIIQPPNTCCVGYNTIRTKRGDDEFYGDYILIDTNKMKFIINNKIPLALKFYDARLFPTSDHLPIYSKIIIK